MNQEVVTRSELSRLGLDALNKETAGAVMVSRSAGGVSFASAMEVMEFAKLMAVADKAVPKHLRANPGACLRIVFQAVEWQMSPWAVADKSYEVNDRIAYESQLIHAVIEARAPLRERLNCEYAGEGIERACIVTGNFRDGSTRSYQTPKFKDIRIKNSPLWKDDPDQQLFYYASRAWARKWCPDVLMGIYTREEAAEMQPIEEAEAGLKARLVDADPSREEGHKDGHADSELDQIAPASGGTTVKAPRGKGKKTAAAEPEKPAEEKVEAETAEEEGNEPSPNSPIWPKDKVPKNADEYALYMRSWLFELADADKIQMRWTKERKLRNDCGVTSDDRKPLEEDKDARMDELKAKK